MVGPNPHRLFSFAELRAFARGPLWVRCDRCRRFKRLHSRPIADRDWRTTRFKCTACGGPGYVAIERPDTEQGREDYRLEGS